MPELTVGEWETIAFGALWLAMFIYTVITFVQRRRRRRRDLLALESARRARTAFGHACARR